MGSLHEYHREEPKRKYKNITFHKMCQTLSRCYFITNAVHGQHLNLERVTVSDINVAISLAHLRKRTSHEKVKE